MNKCGNCRFFSMNSCFCVGAEYYGKGTISPHTVAENCKCFDEVRFPEVK